MYRRSTVDAVRPSARRTPYSQEFSRMLAVNESHSIKKQKTMPITATASRNGWPCLARKVRSRRIYLPPASGPAVQGAPMSKKRMIMSVASLVWLIWSRRLTTFGGTSTAQRKRARLQ